MEVAHLGQCDAQRGGLQREARWDVRGDNTVHPWSLLPSRSQPHCCFHPFSALIGGNEADSDKTSSSKPPQTTNTFELLREERSLHFKSLQSNTEQHVNSTGRLCVLIHHQSPPFRNLSLPCGGSRAVSTHCTILTLECYCGGGGWQDGVVNGCGWRVLMVHALSKSMGNGTITTTSTTQFTAYCKRTMRQLLYKWTTSILQSHV